MMEVSVCCVNPLLTRRRKQTKKGRTVAARRVCWSRVRTVTGDTHRKEDLHHLLEDRQQPAVVHPDAALQHRQQRLHLRQPLVLLRQQVNGVPAHTRATRTRPGNSQQATCARSCTSGRVCVFPSVSTHPKPHSYALHGQSITCRLTCRCPPPAASRRCW